MSVAHQHEVSPAEDASEPSSSSGNEPPIEIRHPRTLKFMTFVARCLDHFYGSPNPQIQAFYRRDASARGRRDVESLDDSKTRLAP